MCDERKQLSSENQEWRNEGDLVNNTNSLFDVMGHMWTTNVNIGTERCTMSPTISFSYRWLDLTPGSSGQAVTLTRTESVYWWPGTLHLTKLSHAPSCGLTASESAINSKFEGCGNCHPVNSILTTATSGSWIPTPPPALPLLSSPLD